MNRETLKELQESDDLRVRSIAKLAVILDISFEDAQRLREGESKQLEQPDKVQQEFEAAMDAEFRC